MPRLDSFMVQSGLAGSREKAKRLIVGGCVSINGVICQKPSQTVDEGTEITVNSQSDYVGRGALKLIGAFENFDIEVKNKVCADIGASTGGFTEVLLERGACHVYAVDVGHGQLAEKLCCDRRVTSLEGVNARYLTADIFASPPEFACCDLSFISLRQTILPIAASIAEGADIVALIKPQFEAGREALGKNGILKDRKKHEQILMSLVSFFTANELSPQRLIPSPICGGDGNIEYLVHLKKGGSAGELDIKRITAAAFDRG